MFRSKAKKHPNVHISSCPVLINPSRGLAMSRWGGRSHATATFWMEPPRFYTIQGYAGVLLMSDGWIILTFVIYLCFRSDNT